MHRVAVLVQDGVVAVELAVAVEVFETANQQVDEPAYEVGVAGADKWVAASTSTGPAFAVRSNHGWSWADRADTVIVPAHRTFLHEPPAAWLTLLPAVHRRGARIASLCTGAFAVASTGLLDGRPATTHWGWSAEFAERFPAVKLIPERLFVGEDRIYSSGGVTAALDLCLHLVQLDLGAAVAADTARHLVAPMRREGGQSQFISYDTPSRPDELAATLAWAEEHLADDLTVADLAHQAAMSPRTFNRRFLAGVGVTPMRWLLRTRIHRAKELLERTDLSVDQVAHQTGFRSAVTFRHHFGRFTETTPQRYRSAFSSRNRPRIGQANPPAP
ncbi:MAG TPA: helix-turn-helix domain-containing protein [Pseudonocardia sp.]|jgi:transcriptional regulator GlxA family with amidase domain|nr:helix-turn-helix domain-containing protein [Pseudonocardia sp.]